MINFSIKESLNKLKNKKYDNTINKNIDYLNNYDEYQLLLLSNSEGLKLNNLIRLNFVENVGFNCYNIQQERYGRLPLCRNIENFLNEQYKNSLTGVKNIIDFLKSELIDYEGYNTWEEFVEQQKLGDCQSIVYKLEDIGKMNKLPIDAHFGEIEIDDEYYNVNEDEYIDRFVHHWITINGEIFEFSKGTHKNYIEYDDLYNVKPKDICKYHQIN